MKKQTSVLFYGFCLMLLHFAQTAAAQGEPNIYTPPVIPVSPTAAALSRYGEIPVNYSTGTVGVSIPFYTIQKDWISLPIGLSYHTSGMRTEDIASRAGMGWSLNYGGNISRQVRGKPDGTGTDPTIGIIARQQAVENFMSGAMPESEAYYYLEDIADGDADSEQDFYYINSNGFSGKFFYEQEGTLLTVPESKLKVEFGTYFSKKGWKATATNGTKYYFLDPEYTSTSTVPNKGETTLSGPDITNWYISRIENANSTDSILFDYESTSYSFDLLGSETAYNCTNCFMCDEPSIPNLTTTINSTITGKRLTRIRSNGLQIDFLKKAAQRCDLPGDYALEGIRIKNQFSDVAKEYRLYQSYIRGSSGETTCTSAPAENKRLFLDSIKVKSSSGIYEPYYRMGYNHPIVGAGYPSRKTTLRDHWGYFSNNGNPTSLIVTNDFTRRPDNSRNQLGSLKTLYYPTGGKTEFEYETNTASNIPDILLYRIKTKTHTTTSTPTPLSTAGTVSVTFTVTSEEEPIENKAKIENTFSYRNGSSFTDPDDLWLGNANITLRDNTWGIETSYGGNAAHIIELVTGHNYTLSASYFINADGWVDEFYLGISWDYNEALPPSKEVGGLRIKTLSDYDQDGALANRRSFSYDLPDAGFTSGLVSAYPFYKGIYNLYSQKVIGGEAIERFCPYETRSSYSNYSLASANSSTVQYDYVKETFGPSSEAGANEYWYLNYPDVNYSYQFPFPPRTTREWGVGLLLRKNVYAGTGGGMTLVQSTGYKYDIRETSSSKFSRGLKVGEQERLVSVFIASHQRKFKSKEYTDFSGIAELVSDTVINYYPGQVVKTITNRTYDPTYFNLANETTTGSDGKVTKISYTYPMDEPAGIMRTTMINRNMLSVPLSTKTLVNGGLKKTQKTTYELSGTGSLLPKKNEQSFDTNPLETEVVFNKYDAMDNLLSYTTIGNQTKLLLWGYKGRYVVAEISNIDTSALSTYLAAHPDIQATFDAPASDAALRTKAQALRTNFPNAMIRSYTYKPLTGMTSKAEVNGAITFYEYDGFGRLKAVKDQEGNILSENSYKYQSAD